MENLGEKIKRLRSEKGFSQANLHQNQSAVAQIENGYNSKPKKQTLVQIAKNLEMSFEELVIEILGNAKPILSFLDPTMTVILPKCWVGSACFE